MGCKAVREAYGIGHIVKTEDGVIHIGSAYIGDIIVVTREGRITKRDDRGQGELGRYMRDIEADPGRFARLLASDDVFEHPVRVYTWEGADIVERLCETPGWPNVTHDGHLMHDNRYSTDRDEAIGWAHRDADAALRIYADGVADAKRELARREALLNDAQAVSARLDAEQPQE